MKSTAKLLCIFLILTVIGFVFASCKNNADSKSLPTGAITGKAVYANHNDSKGIIITLEKTDGERALEVVDKIAIPDVQEERSLIGTTSAKSTGSFSFNELEDGNYTIYATSNISSERAVYINATVSQGNTTDAGELKLTATGSLKGTILIDETETDNEGISVFISGTSFITMTNSKGEYKLTGIPAGSNYELIISKGLFSKSISKEITVTANTETTVAKQKITSKEILENNPKGEQGEKGDQGEQGEKGDQGDDYSLVNDIIYKNTYADGAYKPVFEIADVVAHEYPIHKSSGDSTITLFHAVNNTNNEEITDVPYVNFTDMEDYIFYGSNRTITSQAVSDGVIKFTHNNSDLFIDTVNQTMRFVDYDNFVHNSSTSILDINTSNYLKKGIVTSTRLGSSITIDLKSYGIPVFEKDGDVYMSLQTLNDVFNCKMMFNGVKVFYMYQDDTYYDDSYVGERSDILTDFNYKELCLRMDLQYGLKELHNISSFDKYFTDTGLKTDFYGTSKQAMDALAKLTQIYIADYHTNYNYPSAYAGEDYEPDISTLVGASYSFLDNKRDELRELRKAAMNNNKMAFITVDGKKYIDGYSVYDNYPNNALNNTKTAYITFDSFNFSGTDYYQFYDNQTGNINVVNLANAVDDTIGLVIYAHQKIKADPTINRVVVDLSINGGGAVDALFFINAWLQGQTNFVLKNTITGAIEENKYFADVNLNGDIQIEYPENSGLYVFDKDTLPSLDRNIKVYCITSPYSFSCGNALPTLLKAYRGATIIGQTSGGGACAVGDGCTTDGADFQISSNLKIGYIKNGVFYDADKGVEPDIPITDYTNVYDREKFTAFLNTLN